MKAHNVSKDSKITLEEKLEAMESYSTGDLLYVVREYENCPRKFEDEVIKKLATLLYDKGIICM